MNTQLLIIGAGPGGYVAAFHAADCGLEVTLVDDAPILGGVCLNKGCLPSKTLLHAAKILSESKKASQFGIHFDDLKINIDQLRNQKNNVVTKLTAGLAHLCKQRKINHIQGQASFIDSHTVEILKQDNQKETLPFKNAIIATGSSPIKLPTLPVSPHIWDSTQALDLTGIPKSLLVIGGGYIGLELGTVYAALGSKVSIIEMTSTLLPEADPDLVNILQRQLKRKFHKLQLNTKIISAENSDEDVTVHLENNKGQTSTETFTKVLVSIGRKPNTANIGLENTHIEKDEKNFIQVNAQRQTAEKHIYAIGDVTGNPMLAHKASHEARVAVENILNKKATFTPKAIPAVMFTDPEIAWCGLTETEANTKNIHVQISTFPWSASGRAISLNRPDGLTKLIIDSETKKILGIGIVGTNAGELIAEGTLAIEKGLTAEDLKNTIHPHPTLSETLMESAEGAFGHYTHIIKQYQFH
ncbi:Dihydrolipoamide dehydrogenase of pyruvate dehydrogenase complex [hydrothermal vent metagenome]|uniref:dihydrolipoyl dehydrogenase n=1 Tax=hydrothermal vent metagenome TaxID=652676 RepID=A0A3B1DKR7_9ZZZZ